MKDGFAYGSATMDTGRAEMRLDGSLSFGRRITTSGSSMMTTMGGLSILGVLKGCVLVTMLSAGTLIDFEKRFKEDGSIIGTSCVLDRVIAFVELSVTETRFKAAILAATESPTGSVPLNVFSAVRLADANEVGDVGDVGDLSGSGDFAQDAGCGDFVTGMDGDGDVA